ncbi:transporter [Pseudoroseomonas rhizosphaerae]|uniref:Transporter n=1 Tax=Teichococcus rhizosphaerae TaxID=1335062 RepID=A0A2C7AA25_9PROT|nr:tripartite tricarboxylate transporter substrate binding protein [Pseudoroseomonas rhizosphaerae]PHK94483.1 transporter [Pseudoroseomonas rhizosphaerae]
MTRRPLLAALLGLAALAAPLLPRPAAAYPERPVTLVTGYAPGGSTDIAARLLAERLGQTLAPAGGEMARVVVENRPGAAGIVASEWLRRQPADGYVIMLVESGSHGIAPNALVGGTRYDPVKDFTHLAVLGTGPLVVIASPAFPPRDARSLLATLREAPPESITYASSGVATPNHLTSEMLAVVLGNRFVHVPYRSGGQQVQAIHQNQGQWGVAVLASAAGQIRGGLVRPLALTGLERFPTFPDIPTLAESGLPGFDLQTWNVILGPPDMPPAVVERLNRAINAALAEEPFRNRLIESGVAPWRRSNTPADARAFMEAEVAKFQEVVKRTGVKLEQ